MCEDRGELIIVSIVHGAQDSEKRREGVSRAVLFPACSAADGAPFRFETGQIPVQGRDGSACALGDVIGAHIGISGECACLVDLF